MKTFTISSALVLACAGGALAGDMRIDFPLFMRAPVPATVGAATNLQVGLFPSTPLSQPSLTRNQTFTGALGGAVADPVCFPTSERGEG